MAVAVAANTQAGEAQRAVPACLPLGGDAPRGAVRWHLLQVPEGRELATCGKLKRILPPEALADAFVVFREDWFKREGVWSPRPVQLWRGYAFAATSDAEVLGRALRTLSFPVRLAAAGVPLAPEAQAWLESALDASRVLRTSVAVLEDGRLRVVRGPLAGQERRVSNVDRHRRRCLVRVCDADGGFSLPMPIDVPSKA